MKKRLLIIIIAFGVSFFSMIALSLFSMERFTTFTNYSDLVDHTNSVIAKVYTTEVYLRDIDRSERGYMITRDTMYMRHFNEAVDSIYTTIAQIDKNTFDNPHQQNNVSLLKSSVAIRIAAARENINYVDTSNSGLPSKYYYDSRQMMLECSRLLGRIHDAEAILLSERSKQQFFYQQLTNDTLISLLVIFCVITLILFSIMIKELRGRIRFQEELQARVIDLKRSHSELQEIAYAASHDLQEPLRKIQVFSDMLLYKKTGGVDEEAKVTLARISNSAGRMQLLINDLTSLTNLTKIDEAKTTVNLVRLIHFILVDIEEKIKEKDATVDVQPLPNINGYENQLRILFKALLDNSLKFTRDGVRPVITISSDTINGHELTDLNPNLLTRKFYRITFSDNGIGFDNQFITKIFQIFQRLHTQQSDYEGKGIGLAICQRIMANHEGYITAHGEPGMGAKFKFFFPIEG